MLCNVRDGDEVILPSYTFVSTANAFVLRGAKPVFVDIRPETLTMDERLLEDAVTERTKLIVPVHYAGVACEMDAIAAVAEKHDLLVVEDAAQAVNATYRGRHLGTIGRLGCYSFHETKNFISGEGGALVVNSEDMVERAEIIRDKGTNRQRFFRGEVDKYTWVDIGSSFLASELTAAFLLAQLEEADTITEKRSGIFDYYLAELQPLADRGWLTLPTVPPDSRHNAHLFYVLVEDEPTRTRLIGRLREAGINAVFHYVPLHTSPMGRHFGWGPGDLPVTEDVAPRLLRLPCFFELERPDQDRVVDALFAFFGEKR